MTSWKLRILIVDDTESRRTSHELILAKQGYHVETAVSGMEAMAKLDVFVPDLIILDATTPKAGGIECCKQIKSSEQTRDIKVVMVSSNDDYLTISEAFAAGCDDYVIKPVDRNELVLTVNNMLKFCRSRSSYYPKASL